MLLKVVTGLSRASEVELPGAVVAGDASDVISKYLAPIETLVRFL